MFANKVIHVPTSQDQPAYIWHHRGHDHGGGQNVSVPVKLPKTMYVDGFPTEGYHVSVTPDQPCVISVKDKTKYGFTVELTSLDARPLADGSFSVMVIG